MTHIIFSLQSPHYLMFEMKLVCECQTVRFNLTRNIICVTCQEQFISWRKIYKTCWQLV